MLRLAPLLLLITAGAALQAAGTWSVLTLPQQPGRVSNPAAVAVDGAGNLYEAETYPYNRVQKRDPQGNWSIITTRGNGPGQVTNPAGVAVDGVGNLFVSEGYSNRAGSGDRVQERDSHGNWTVLATRGAEPGQVSDPRGLAVDAAGTLYVADDFNSRIQQRDPKGHWSVLAHDVPDPYDAVNPTDVAVDGAGSLYVLESFGLLHKRDPQGRWSTLATRGHLSDPRGLAVDGAGNLYVSEDGNGYGRIRKRDPQGRWSVIGVVAQLPRGRIRLRRPSD